MQYLNQEEIKSCRILAEQGQENVPEYAAQQQYCAPHADRAQSACQPAGQHINPAGQARWSPHQ